MEIIEIFPQTNELSSILNTKNIDGSLGSNREKVLKCQIDANNDLAAIYSWLAGYKHKPTTYRSYKKEAERLLLWCIYDRKKPLSSLDRDDFTAYFNFLSLPTPKDFWCTSDNIKYSRAHRSWRPFSGALSISAKNTAITIINSLMNFLFNARYLEFNPLNLMRNVRDTNQSFQESKIKVLARILEDDEWDAIKETLIALPETTSGEKAHKVRLRFIVAILFLLGLRINELEIHLWNAFRLYKGKWWFFVKGKGDKLGMIPVNDELLQEIEIYRNSIGLPELPAAEDNIPIIKSIRNSEPITARQMHKLLKKLALEASNKIDDQYKKQKLRKFSPHWLRHLSATMQDKVGIQFKHIKENHRHENDMTTRKYIHSFDEERHNDMQRLNLNFNGNNTQVI